MTGQPQEVVLVNCSNRGLLPFFIFGTGWIILWLGVAGLRSLRRRVLIGGLTSSSTVVFRGCRGRGWTGTWSIGRRLLFGDSPICCYLGCSDTLFYGRLLTQNCLVVKPYSLPSYHHQSSQQHFLILGCHSWSRCSYGPQEWSTFLTLRGLRSRLLPGLPPHATQCDNAAARHV